MSKENVKAFFGAAEQDATLKATVTAAIQNLNNPDDQVLGDTLIELGAGAGFTFTLEDLKAARAEMVDLANAEDGELSDEDLSAVAGGALKAGDVALSFVYFVTFSAFGDCQDLINK